jgi:tetratricopeptide (TPR) repeat protein
MMAHGFLGRNGLSWYQAKDYCSSLQLSGFTGWRLPTLEEAKAVTVVRKIVSCCSSHLGEPKAIAEAEIAFESTPTDFLFLKGSISTFSKDLVAVYIWTSTPSQSDPNSAWAFAIPWGQFFTKPLTNQEQGVICVRPMEPDLLQTAKAAEVDHPVPDIQTLQTFIPLNKARLAYQAGNYQESIVQAQIAISLKADPAVAYWGIGISYGRLGKWDQAISSLQTALSIDKNSNDAMAALRWAKGSEEGEAAQRAKPQVELNSGAARTVRQHSEFFRGCGIAERAEPAPILHRPAIAPCPSRCRMAFLLS